MNTRDIRSLRADNDESRARILEKSADAIDGDEPEAAAALRAKAEGFRAKAAASRASKGGRDV